MSRNAGAGGEWFIGPKCRFRLHCALTVHGSGNWTSTLWQNKLHSPLLAPTARLLRPTMMAMMVLMSMTMLTIANKTMVVMMMMMVIVVQMLIMLVMLNMMMMLKIMMMMMLMMSNMMLVM